MNIHFAFSERLDPHHLKFVQFFSTQPISNYFTLQRYIALGSTTNMKVQITKRKLCDEKVEASLLIHRIDTV